MNKFIAMLFGACLFVAPFSAFADDIFYSGQSTESGWMVVGEKGGHDISPFCSVVKFHEDTSIMIYQDLVDGTLNIELANTNWNLKENTSYVMDFRVVFSDMSFADFKIPYIVTNSNTITIENLNPVLFEKIYSFGVRFVFSDPLHDINSSIFLQDQQVMARQMKECVATAVSKRIVQDI